MRIQLRRRWVCGFTVCFDIEAGDRRQRARQAVPRGRCSDRCTELGLSLVEAGEHRMSGDSGKPRLSLNLAKIERQLKARNVRTQQQLFIAVQAFADRVTCRLSCGARERRR